ncbi:hypothetical protein BDW02DRAFT_69411 [Decorospora gaudefroyi]|uniref:Uncharacterized protein n=1 Tax=Decorospora gaudefroyi TaxID=184978 RepID=A0A6A5K2T7_9PLEO|nr:hypothetical protein BDW02DRAFT_69411 [Decorospora gaudefroyi]
MEIMASSPCNEIPIRIALCWEPGVAVHDGNVSFLLLFLPIYFVATAAGGGGRSCLVLITIAIFAYGGSYRSLFIGRRFFWGEFSCSSDGGPFCYCVDGGEKDADGQILSIANIRSTYSLNKIRYGSASCGWWCGVRSAECGNWWGKGGFS